MNTKTSNRSILYRAAAIFMTVIMLLAAMPVTPAYAAVSTPTFTNFAGTTGPFTITNAQFACAAGTNRLLVAVVTAEYNFNPEVMGLTATKGAGVNFSQAVKTTGNTRTGIWVGYLTETQIASNTNSIVITEQAGGDPWRSANVHLTCLTGVNQATPIVAGGTAFNSSDADTGSYTFNNVPAVNTGLMIYTAGHNGSNNFTAPTGYTESVDVAGSSHRTTAGYKVVTATGNESGTITFNNNDRYAAAVISVNPAVVVPVAPNITSANAATFTVGAANTFTVTATGSPAPTFAVTTGALPTGVTLSTAGVLSGTPAAGTVGTYPVTITASNGVLPNATQNFTLTVQKANTTTTISSDLPDPSLTGQNVVVNYTVASAGNAIAFTGNVTVSDGANNCIGTAAAGTCTLALTTAGNRTLTATYAGDANFNGSASAGAGHVVSTPVAPTITSANTATFTVGIANTFTMTATGSPTPTFAVTAGTLPSGVTLNAAGVLNGTPATGTVGTYPITITASNGVLPNATQNFTLTVQGSPEMNVLGNGISIVDGDTTPTQGDATDFGLVGPGISVFTTYTIQNTGTDNLTLGAITIGGAQAADFTVTTPPTSPVPSGGSTTFVVRFIPGTGGVAQRNATISIVNNDANENPYNFSIVGFRSASIAEINIQFGGITITDGDTTPSTIDGTDFGSVVVGANNTLTYTIRNLGDQNLTLGAITIGGAQGANYTVFAAPTTPVIPGGSTTFQLRFTPSAVGARNATFSIVNNDTGNGENPYNFNITGTGVAATAPTITSATATTFTAGIAGTFNVTATGSPVPTFAVTTGTLPTGVTLSAAGVLSGTPAAGTVGTYPVTITASNGVLPNATQAFTLTVQKANTTTAVNSDLPDPSLAGENVVVNYAVVSAGNAITPTGNVTVGDGVNNCVGTAAAGTCTLALNTAGARTLTATYAGDANFNGSASAGAAHTVNAAPPTITSAAPANGALGVAYTHTYAATGTAPITFSVTFGLLPDGLTLSSAGVITGTPTTLGTFNGTVTATNGVLPDATQNFSITISQAPSITSADNVSFTLGIASSFTVVTTGSPTPTLSMTGALPSGVSFVPATGVLSGTPAAGTGGTYPLTFTATNGVLPDAVQNFTLTVTAGPSITSADHAVFSLGLPGTFSVTAVGTPTPTLSLVGTLPSGVTFDPGTGILSGTPAAGTVGVYPIIFNAVNGTLPNATQNFTLTVKNGPIVVPNGVNSAPDTGNGSISENESIVNTLGITKLKVRFDQDVLNVASTDPDFAKSVINPANYMLVLGSSTGVFQTVSCLGGVVAPDVAITVNSVTYTNGGGAGPFVATLNINGGLPLNAVGYYRLYVCGTTSIVDAVNTNLELAGNGTTPGTDFVLSFRIQAPNTSTGGGGDGSSGKKKAAASSASAATLIPVTGFAPNKVTVLPAQPASKAYKSLDEIRIEIPTLGINYPIVGVAITNNTWDLTWLKDSVAYLEGSAYPTLPGNTVLTAHVVDANNNLGPFSDIKGMKSGQKIYIHAYGQVYVYQVQENRKLLPTSISTVFNHEEYSWVTLVTCEDYNAKTGLYNYRRMVRAVLISVIPEK